MDGELKRMQGRFLAAQAIAREAGAVLRARFSTRESFKISLKGHQDYVTTADIETEELIVRGLRAAFERDAVLGEERGGEPSCSMWVVDPIDGTANFARGIPHFCTSIGYIHNGTPVLGVTYDPIRDEMFAGLLGGGASVNGRKLHVSAVTSIGEAQVEIGSSLHTGSDAYVKLTSRIASLGAGLLNCGSAALAMAYVAAGRLDAYCESHTRIWDVLAGIVLITEAGGSCTDFLAGSALKIENAIIGCSPCLRETLMSATRIGK